MGQDQESSHPVQQPKWRQSLGGKLFLLMGASLLATVTVISWRNATMFRSFLSQRLQDQAIERAKDSSNSIASIVEGWSGLVTFVMRNAEGDTTAFKNKIRDFVQTNREFVAFQVFGPEDSPKTGYWAFTERTKDVRFRDEVPGEIAGKIKKANHSWYTKTLKGTSDQKLFLRSLEGQTKLPLGTVAIRFDLQEQKKSYWAVLTHWQTRLLKSLPESKSTGAVVFHNTGEPLYSVGNKELGPLVKNVVNMSSPFGFRPYVSPSGNDRLGAFSRLPRYGLTVAISLDPKTSKINVWRIVFQTALWSWIILLFALMISYVSVAGITRKLKHITLATQKIAAGDFETRVHAPGKDEASILAHSVQSMAGQIQELMQAKVEAARQEKELETARVVQNTLFPKGEIEHPGFYVTAKSMPASECGGDWWGHFRGGDGQEYVLVADATGHGAGAALVTAIAYSACKTVANTVKHSKTPLSPAELLKTLNRIMYQAGAGTTTMTFFAARIDVETRKMVYANAGHNLPFIIPYDATDERLITKRRSENNKRYVKIQGGGMPLGMLNEEEEYDERELQLKVKDKLVFYTDGLIECVNEEGKQWGEKSMRAVIQRAADESAVEVKKALLNESTAFFGSHPIDDDVTLVIVEVQERSAATDAA